MSSRWSALHVHLHGGTSQLDRLLREHIVPATTELLARGEASSWFFVRYWEGGPHLRWRLADATPATLGRAREALVAAVAADPAPESELTPDAWYGRFGDAGRAGTATRWQPHGTVLERPYEPEIERYGGPAAIGAAEELFAASSRVAATLLAAPPARRRSTTVDLLFAFLAAAELTGPGAVGFLRRYANGWSQVAEAADADLGSVLRLAEQDFHRDPAAYRERRRRIAEVVATRRGAPTSVNFWADATAGYVARLRDLRARGQLGLPIPSILASQLHMLHNRLGLGIPAEAQLAWLAAKAHLDAAPEPDLHADGGTAADRAYHERAKFVPALWPTQHPRTPDRADEPGPAVRDEPEPPAAGGPRRPAADVPLPAPTPGALATTSLAEALLTRRSRHDFRAAAPAASATGPSVPVTGPSARVAGPSVPVTGPSARVAELDATELGRLLYYAAGERGMPPRRAYPTAGGLAGTRLMVLPRHVAGVPSALYEYLPQGHALRRIAPDPGVGRLARVAPQFDSGDPAAIDAIDVSAVALWLFVVVDLERCRSRYGVRAYRFTALEAGHLAQNVLLAATAAGLSAMPVGGFFDDHLDHLLLLDGLTASGFYLLLLGPAPAG